MPTASKYFARSAAAKRSLNLKVSVNYILNELNSKLKGKAIILGIGNVLRGDDAFGSVLAKEIKDKISLKVFDAETSPENFLGAILKEKPDSVLFVDTVDFGQGGGRLKLFDLDAVKTKNFFLTHDTSLSLLFDFLKDNSKIDMYLLAIQPTDTAFGANMSPEIQRHLEELTVWFKERYPINGTKNN